jgi:hypothetical protein
LISIPKSHIGGTLYSVPGQAQEELSAVPPMVFPGPFLNQWLLIISGEPLQFKIQTNSDLMIRDEFGNLIDFFLDKDGTVSVVTSVPGLYTVSVDPLGMFFNGKIEGRDTPYSFFLQC